MSFVTKRERVFNEYKLYDLPARNEGKLKAYASCTDARAWSHFISDKTDHLFEIIKRNNEKCRPKYVPTEVIVDTLMMAKNAQISRLKQKMKELERLLAAYGRLELNEEQRSEINKAHATIKAANKELDVCIDLDLFGDAEGVDSEVFGSGKSRGDEIRRSTTVETAKSSVSEWSYIKEPTSERSRDEQSYYEEIDDEKDEIDGAKPKSGDRVKLSSDQVKFRDSGTNAEEDSRIEELQDMIVSKDAKLNAMQNTIAVLENDVCEPYCIYAHIYTALEKIFGILRQNLKYKQYLDLLTLGRDLRQIHIKGKILYKIKILEKFSIALIAPCSLTDKPQSCTCYRAEVLTGYETTYAVSATESSQTILDKKRARLIADIIDVDELKETLNNQSFPKSQNDTEFFDVDECNTENKCRLLLKSLQLSYSELVTCYDNLKSEKDLLYIRCQELLKVEEENEYLRNLKRDYNNLWNEMEYFRQRSENLDKSNIILSNETATLQTKFIAEFEKNKIKLDTISNLRNENLLLDKKLKELSLLHEKEINSLIFKIKEIECDSMCKNQQIKSLSSDIEKYVNQKYTENNTLQIYERFDQVIKGRGQLHSGEICICKNVAIEELQQEINKNLEFINELKLETDTWEKKYDDAVNTIDTLKDEIRITNIINQDLSDKIVEKTNAVDNLHNILQNKLEQIEILNEELERQESNNILLSMELHKIRHGFETNLPLIDNNNELKNSHDCQEHKKHQNTEFYNQEAKDSNNELKISFADNPHPDDVENIIEYSDNLGQYTELFNIPEKEDTNGDNILHDLDKYVDENDILQPIKKNSQEINSSKKTPPIPENAHVPTHKNCSIEISEIQNDLKKRLSLLEQEQQFFIKQNSADTDTEFVSLSDNAHYLEDNQRKSNSNSTANDFLSQIELIQSTSLIAKCDDFMEQGRKSLSLTKKEVDELQNEIKKSKDKNIVEGTVQNIVLDKCIQNENLTDQLKQKNSEIKKLLMEIDKMRNNFHKKIAILEKEKNKLLNDAEKSQNNSDLLTTFNENDSLLLNELQSSDTNCDQKDVISQFKLLSEESLATINKYDSIKKMYQDSLEIAKNESEDIKLQVTQLNKVSQSLDELMSKYNKLLNEKNILQNEQCENEVKLNNLKNQCLKLQHIVQELEPFKLKYEVLCTEIENKLTNKEKEINQLQKANTLLERDIEILTTSIDDLKQKNHHLEHNFKVDKEKINTELEGKKYELYNIQQQMLCIKKENNELMTQIDNLRDSSKKRISLLENDILSMKSQIGSTNKIITEKDVEISNLKILNEKFSNDRIHNDEIENQNNKLKQDLDRCKICLTTLENENNVVKLLNENIFNEIITIKIALKIKEDEIIRFKTSLTDIKEDIKKIKLEKKCDTDRMSELLNKLQICEQIINKLKDDLTERNHTIFEMQNLVTNLQEENKNLHENLKSAAENTKKLIQEENEKNNQFALKEQVIFELREDLSQRKNTISELQNHINILQKEIKNLHGSLDIAMEDSEKISQEDIEEIDQSTRKIKAHYTKATHNIKPEMSKLQDISERLKLLKFGSKEKNTDEQKCVSRINSLENERETVIHHLNQLEIAVLGICNLTNKSCTKDMIDVLHNIQKAYENKDTYFEKRLENSQSSYQLLKNKAEEAHEMVETERQKMISEKENNEINIHNMEKRIQHLNEQSHKKDIKYNDIIKELEMKLLKQQSLFDEINASKESHIEKIQNEVSNLIEVNDKLLADINVLEQKLRASEQHCNSQSHQMNKLNNEYQKNIQIINNKATVNNIKTETSFEMQKANKNIQTNLTDSLLFTSHIEAINSNMDTANRNSSFVTEDDTTIDKEIVKTVLAPSVDIVRNKLAKLQTRTLEHYSICALTCDSDLNNFNELIINADDSVKYLDIDKIHSRKRLTTDVSLVLVSNISDGNSKKELKGKKKCDDKKTQTDDYYNQFPNNFTDGDIILPHQISLKNDLSNYFKKEKNTNLSENHRSQKNSSVKDLKSNKTFVTNQYAPNKQFNESLDSAEKNITERSQKVQPLATLRKISNCDSKAHLTLHSKVMSLDDVAKEEKFIHHDFQTQQNDRNLYQNRYSIEKNSSISKINTNEKELNNHFLSASKLIPNTQEQTNNETNNINYLTNDILHKTRRCRSYENIFKFHRDIGFEKSRSNIVLSTNLARPIKSSNTDILENLKTFEMYGKKIENLSKALESQNKHLKKIEDIKHQYENHIKRIINEHNKGVVNIQTFHEETLSDVIRIHDIQIENLRALSIEAMTKSEKLERENKKLRLKMELNEVNQRPAKLAPQIDTAQKRKSKSRTSPSYLTKTDIEAFNVKPKRKSTASCTCTMNINVTDAIRNIFMQVDTTNKRIAEETYLKCIADKLMDGVEKLNPQELSFLHLKVCRVWKTIRARDKALKGDLELSGQELMALQPHPVRGHEHEPDKVTKDRRRCQDRKKATCKTVPVEIADSSPQELSINSCKRNKNCCGCVYNLQYNIKGYRTSRVKKVKGSEPITEKN